MAITSAAAVAQLPSDDSLSSPALMDSAVKNFTSVSGSTLVAKEFNKGTLKILPAGLLAAHAASNFFAQCSYWVLTAS